MPRIRVLVVDDSVVARRLVTEALAGVPDVEVVGTAADGRMALSLIRDLVPNVVTLDVEMPEMDGLAAMTAIHAAHPKLPVIMFSSYTERGAMVTIEALARGAADYVTKPAGSGNYESAVRQVRADLVPKILSLCTSVVQSPRPVQVPTRLAPPPPRPILEPRPRPVDVVAIGASTGGPNALERVLSVLPPDFPAPIVIVQHMPPRFTKFLAERLAGQSSLKVFEAAGSERLQPGAVWLAPGDFHVKLERARPGVATRLDQSEPVNSCRPSVDVLFQSVAEVYGSRSLAVVLTGMGRDGLAGCRQIREAGGKVIVQDEPSSVVWGMPGAVAEAGLADKVLPLDRIAAGILSGVRAGRHAAQPAESIRGETPELRESNRVS
jgi:two-component system chemotaxis response regulator CheB